MNRLGLKRGSVVLLALLLLAPGIVRARDMSELDVKAAVETWVRQVPSEARADAVIESMEPYTVDGETYGYIAHLAGGGFCLCGADDVVLPVYFYCPEGNYDPGCPDLEYILWEIKARTRGLRQGIAERHPDLAPYAGALDDRARFWSDLRAGRAPARMEEKDERSEPYMMKLNILTHWGQGRVYNDQCPPFDPNNECVVGCVGTALAMIMNYWQWPPSGTSSRTVSYTRRWRFDWDDEPCPTNPDTTLFPGTWENHLRWTTINGGTLEMTGYWDGSVLGAAENISEDSDYRGALSALYGRLTSETTNWTANFGATAYDWSLLDTVHAEPVDPGDVEVAKVSFHAAVSVGMNFGGWSSGSHTSYVADAVEDYFQYDADATFSSTNITTMTNDIAWLRPVQLGGQRPAAEGGGGHSWVVHGYDKAGDPDRLFYMNFGWYGRWDGWYAADNIPPANFILEQGHTYRIAPEYWVRFVDTSGSGDGTPNDPWGSIAEVVSEHPDGAIIIFKGGSDYTFTSPVTLDRPCTLRGYDVVIRPL